MDEVIISLASNCDQEKNLHQAHLCLEQILSSCRYTKAIWTEPYVGGNASKLCNEVGEASKLCKVADEASPTIYLNQLVYATTSLTVDDLQSALKDIELRLGRIADDRQQGIVRIDLDLLQYDGQRYHLRDWDRPYIKALLREQDCEL